MMFYRKRYVESLKDTIRYFENQLDGRDKNIKSINEKLKEEQATVDALGHTIEDRDDTISALKKDIEKLKIERDILYKYYEIDKEPSQEVKTQMRIDMRVHDLELEATCTVRRKTFDSRA